MREMPPDHEQHDATWGEAEAWDDAPGTIDAEVLVQRRASPRKRLIQGGIALLCALVVIGLFHSAIRPPANPAASAPLSVPDTPSMVAIIANVSYGTVTVNGKRLAGRPPFIYHASSGGDTVTFSAPPFAPRTCHITWASDGITVELGTSGNGCSSGGGNMMITANGRTANVTNYLEFDFGADDLPAALKSSAEAFVEQLITPVSLYTTVPAGQYYAVGRDSHGMILSHIATTPLTVRILLSLPVVQELTSPQFFCQEIICTGIPFDMNIQQEAPIGKAWSVMVPLAMDWQFLNTSKQVVGAEHQSEISAPISLSLTLDDANNWQLAQPISLAEMETEQYDTTACGIGMNELQNALQTEQVGNSSVMNNGLVNNPNNQGLAGCEIQIVQSDGTVTGNIVWRFGVLLAADSKTHRSYPWLPLAPKAEVDAVSGSAA